MLKVRITSKTSQLCQLRYNSIRTKNVEEIATLHQNKNKFSHSAYALARIMLR